MALWLDESIVFAIINVLRIYKGEMKSDENFYHHTFGVIVIKYNRSTYYRF